MEDYSELRPSETWTAEYLSNPAIFAEALRVNPERAFNLLKEVSLNTARLRQEAEATAARAAREDGIQSLLARLVELQAQQHATPAVSSSSSSPVPPPVLRSAKLPTPSFDGKSENLRPFIGTLTNKLQGNADHFRSEFDQVAFAYQCLSDRAADRIRSHFRHLYDPSAAPEITSIKAFVDLLQRYFSDPAARQKADSTLNTFAQRNLPFHEFIARFEDLLADSSWAEYDRSAAWIKLLQPKLSDELYDKVVAADAVPKTYDAYVDWLRAKDTLIQARKATRPERATPTSRPAPAAARPALAVPAVPVAPVALPVSRGGSAMDLDSKSKEKGPDGKLTPAAKDARRALGRCLRCNEAGHIAISCPLGLRPALRSASPVAATVSPAPTEELKDQL
jgi:hypothetical protein